MKWKWRTAGHMVLPFLVYKSEFFRANGYAHLVSGTHAVGGFALAGVIIVLLGNLDSIVLYSAAMASACAVSLFIPLVTKHPEERGNGGLAEGRRYLVANHRSLILTAMYLSLVSFFRLSSSHIHTAGY